MTDRKVFKIGLLEDNRFYNDLLARRIEQYTSAISEDYPVSFRVYSYTSAYDFLRHIPSDLNMAVVDYYLDGDANGTHVLTSIRKKCSRCRVIIISGTMTLKTSLLTILEGATGFIYKDRNALMNTCLAIEEIMKTQGYR